MIETNYYHLAAHSLLFAPVEGGSVQSFYRAMKNGFILNTSLLVILWFILLLMNINTKFKPRRKSQQHSKDYQAVDQRLLMSNTKIEINESSKSFVNCIKEADILMVIKSKPNNFNKRKFIR